MRALYTPDVQLKEFSTIEIKDEAAKHLMVTRIKINETVMLLDGQGLVAKSLVEFFDKKSFQLKILSVETFKAKHQLKVAICLPKKEAFEDMLKMAVELGVSDIYPLSSQFSQSEYKSSERIERVLESALIQSNNPFMPVIHPMQSLESFLIADKSPLYFFNSRPVVSTLSEKTFASAVILIGPEGGFSIAEEEKILSFSHVKSIHLPTPILRAPTALASAIGYLLAKL